MKAKEQAEKIYKWFLRNISRAVPSVTTTPPYEESIKKIRDYYYISLLIKGKDLSKLKMLMRESALFQENAIIIDVDPI